MGKYYFMRLPATNYYEVITFEDSFRLYHMKKDELNKFGETNDLVEVRFSFLKNLKFLNRIPLIYSRRDIAKVSFSKLTESELAVYLCHKMLSERNDDRVAWYSDKIYVIDITEPGEDSILLAYYSENTKELAIKSESDFIRLSRDFNFTDFSYLEYIDFGNAFATYDYYDNYFCGCNYLKELDLTHFNFSFCRSMKKMFYKCYDLHTIKFNNRVVNSSVEDISDLLSECFSLKNIDLSMFTFKKGTQLLSAEECELDYLSTIAGKGKLEYYKSANMEIFFTRNNKNKNE